MRSIQLGATYSKLVRKAIAMTMQASSPRPATTPAMPPGELAWLAYQAIDQSDDIILLLECDSSRESVDPVVIGVNGAFRRASGFSDDQLLGRKATEVFPTGNHAETLVNAIRLHSPLRAELACIRADGGTFILGLHLMPALAPGRDCFVILGRDITAVLQARQVQGSIQRLLAKVFTSVDEAVSIVSSAGRMVVTNPAFDRLFGYKPNEVVGRMSLEMVAHDSRAWLAAMIKEQIGQGQDLTYTAPFLRADGSHLVVRVTSVIVTIEDMKQFRVLTVRPDAPLATRMRTESAGWIQLVGLDEVRTAIGNRWQAVAERVMTTADAVLKRRCGPHDSYSRADDTSFLVCFGALSEKAAASRAAAIGREIREHLIRQGEEPNTAYVRSIAAAVRLPDEGGSTASSPGALLDGLNKQLGRLEAEARHTLQGAWASTACDLEPISGRDPRDTIAAQVRLPAELKDRLVSAMSVLSRKEAEAFDLDGLLLGLTAQHGITAFARGVSMPLLVNVRFDVFLARAATERYVAMCHKIDPRLCERLILVLSSLPQGLSKARLLDSVARLRPFCCGVGYQINDLAALASIDLSNSFNPVVALPASAFAARASAKVKGLISSLQSRRAKVLIMRVESEEDAAAYRLLGADMISMGQQPVF